MKTVLITGGTRGIGRAMVELFSSSGYNVAFTYKNSSGLAKEIAESMGALAVKADSALESDVLLAVKKAEEEFGKIDVLINNAAISEFSLFTDITLEKWNEIFNVNVTGNFLYTREAVRGMIKRKYGRIINISSMWGVVGSSCEVHYSAAKSAIIGMTKALAKELGPSNITVNCIAPGVIDTDMNKNLSKEDIESLKEETPLMRLGTSKEVAEAALFLASDSASFITGAVIGVNGGYVT